MKHGSVPVVRTKILLYLYSCKRVAYVQYSLQVHQYFNTFILTYRANVISDRISIRKRNFIGTNSLGKNIFYDGN